ncbi:MAG: Holliday junction branch migration protein RuvA, partial [Actinomycetes bacterium]
MIASLTGTVLTVSADTAVVEVGGIGLRVQCSGRTVSDLRVGSRHTLATSLVVREDSLTLFGFADSDDRDVFETLQSVSGVGPRLAQAALSVLTADQLRAAVQAQDEVTLTRIPGVGKKGAQRLVLELADKLGSPVNSVSVDVRDTGVVGALSWQGPVREALVSLGWSAKESD